MCGIVAIDIQDISSDQIEEVKRILLETEIRGRHASGISWYSNGQVHTVKASKPISQLLEDFDIYRCVDENDGHLAMIAHIRYSTSDLDYNQPITTAQDFAVVHNGIISQAEPGTWNEEYGLGDPLGRNDSELVLMALEQNKHPLKLFKDSSMAVATLTNKGKVRVFRNGKRPLWLTQMYNGWIATSTRDIVERAEVTFTHQSPAKPGVDYNLTHNSLDVVVHDMVDLQSV